MITLWFTPGPAPRLLPGAQLRALRPRVFPQFLHTSANIVAGIFHKCGGGDGAQGRSEYFVNEILVEKSTKVALLAIFNSKCPFFFCVFDKKLSPVVRPGILT